MATYTSFKFGGATGVVNAANNRPRGLQSVQFDIAKFVAVNGFVSGDVETLLTIPANTRLEIFGVRNDSALALGTTPVFSLGDSSSATLWVNASTVITTGTYQTLATASKVYSAADVLKVTLSNASGTVTSGTFSILYELIDLSANPVAQAAVSV
jgi:hypothetical protein